MKRTKWPFTIRETLAGLSAAILLVLAIATFRMDSRVRQLESQSNLSLDYDVSLESHPILDLSNEDSEYGFVLVPFTIKISNISVNQKISVEKMQSFLLFPTDWQNLASIDNPVVFSSSQSPFPMYLDVGEQRFINCAIAFPVPRNELSKFASENEANLEKLTTYDYIQKFHDNFMQPRIGVKIITPTNLVREFIFSFAEYIESYDVREYWRWNQGN